MSTHHDFVKSYLDAWNNRDANGVAGHFCSDGLYCDIPKQQRLAGEALIAHLVDYFNEDGYHYELIGDVLVNDDTLAFQYRVLPLDPQSGDGAWTGAEFIELRGSSAQRINDYYPAPSDETRRGGRQNGGRRYAKSGLNDAAMARLLQSLQTAMESDRVYLDPDLSLPRLAAQLGCSVNHLSQAINAGHSVSFFDYVNQFRVNEAAQLLRQEDCRFPAILDIALSVGFNSTSTFYTAFKKATGQTPARYRRQAPTAATA